MQRLGIIVVTVLLDAEGHRLQGVQARQQRGGHIGLHDERGLAQAVELHRLLQQGAVVHAVLHVGRTAAQRHQVGLPGRIVVVQIVLGHLQLDVVLALHAEHGESE